ncbi:hypothetical protein H5T52_10075 [Candidatus Bipolaricaulota bacterium]|nr:hypothetical protein [Candidatus Bipolaricaulota bacterium]
MKAKFLAIAWLAGLYFFGFPLSGLGEESLLDQLRAELIPAEGAKTSYGIPLSLRNAQTFADWYYTIRLTPEEEELWQEALVAIPAPCCDDNPVLRCCCQTHGRICNLTRSAQGLAKWLIVYRGFGVEEIRSAVLEWLRFLVPNYYLAKALEEQGLDPRDFGLEPHEAYEACYQGRCEVALDQGGCGGMGLEVKLSALTAVPSCCVPNAGEGK